MIIVYLLLVIWFLSILFWLVDAIRKLDDEIPPEPNSLVNHKHGGKQ
jgi:hypothetical protein